jgi:hypothetical protein
VEGRTRQVLAAVSCHVTQPIYCDLRPESFYVLAETARVAVLTKSVDDEDIPETARKPSDHEDGDEPASSPVKKKASKKKKVEDDEQEDKKPKKVSASATVWPTRIAMSRYPAAKDRHSARLELVTRLG